MNRVSLLDHLAVARQALDLAAARFTDATEGDRHSWAVAAHKRMRLASVATVDGAGPLPWWALEATGLAMVGVVTWAAATVSRQWIGLSAGWTIAVVVAFLCGLAWPFDKLRRVFLQRFHRWRTRARQSLPVAPMPAAASPVAEVVALLRMARDSLAAAMRTRFAECGHDLNNATAFDWFVRNDVSLSRISEADVCVSSALYAIELWLAEPAAES